MGQTSTILQFSHSLCNKQWMFNTWLINTHSPQFSTLLPMVYWNGFIVTTHNLNTTFILWCSAKTSNVHKFLACKVHIYAHPWDLNCKGFHLKHAYLQRGCACKLTTLLLHLSLLTPVPPNTIMPVLVYHFMHNKRYDIMNMTWKISSHLYVDCW